MNKPLTIEQLKSLEVGEWVWIENILGTKLVVDFRNGYYRKGLQDNKPDEHFTTSWYSYNLFFNYNLYGRTWLAYKNKEQAEGEYDSRVEQAKKQTAKAIIGELKGEMAIATYTFNPMLASELKTIYLQLEKEYGVEVDE